MIYDLIDNLHKYLPETCKKEVLDYLKTVDANTEEKVYEILPHNVFANIMSYRTKHIEDCEIEAHDIYCDIQFSIMGEEGITVYDRKMMNERDFEFEKDFHTFENDEQAYCARVRNKVGYFALIHSYEAHRPQESPDGKCRVVKKGVIKVKEELFRE